MNVPFVNMALQYELIRPEVDKAINTVLASGVLIGGSLVSEFEKKFATECGVTHCIGLGNATDGLFLSLKALGIGSGDEVITPAWSWISSAEVISLTGAKVVFADVDPQHFNLTSKSIAEKISPRTKAVILVHLYGQMADVVEIAALCKHKNIQLIEDCSQAHFSKFKTHFAGVIGACGVFSFYPTKNMGAFGDAGCIITNSDNLAEKLRRLANHGGLSKDDHAIEGFNSRLDTLQAAVLQVKLKYIHAWNKLRAQHASVYFSELKTVRSIELPVVRSDDQHTFHLFVIKASNRNELKNFLALNGVQTIIHYPKALPFEPAYQLFNHNSVDFPVATALQDSVLSLPVSHEITTDQILHVCKLIKQFYPHD
jgi:dTDP-4-amino-4,6-dideoxygalactose transaminase